MAVSAEKPLWSGLSTMTVTLASVATANCRSATAVDNSTNRYRAVIVSCKIKSQGTPVVDTVIEVWGLRSDNDGTPLVDGGYADDTGYTLALRPRGGDFLGYVTFDGSATPTGRRGGLRFENPGPKWNLLFINSCGQTLDATGSNHVVSWRGENAELQ